MAGSGCIANFLITLRPPPLPRWRLPFATLPDRAARRASIRGSDDAAKENIAGNCDLGRALTAAPDGEIRPAFFARRGSRFPPARYPQRRTAPGDAGAQRAGHRIQASDYRA